MSPNLLMIYGHYNFLIMALEYSVIAVFYDSRKKQFIFTAINYQQPFKPSDNTSAKQNLYGQKPSQLAP